MNTQIPDDPFSGIQIPQLKQVTQLGDSLGEQAVSVQIDVNQTQLPVFNGSDRTTKRPMKPPPDTIGTQGQDEPQTSEGAAIDDFMNPDRIVIGVEDEGAKKIMAEIYQKFSHAKIIYCDIVTAELIKYASNSFLATKISFINEMADLCEAVGANVRDLS
ncbi:hypothetical protein EBT25_14920, partial [bacterium]|nr:hypothetical protein [bacterium]